MDPSRSSLFIGGIFLTVLAFALFFGAVETDWWIGARVIAGIFGLFLFGAGSYSFKKALVRFSNPSEGLVIFLSLAASSGMLCYFDFVPFYGRFFFGVLGMAIFWAIIQSWLNWRAARIM